MRSFSVAIVDFNREVLIDFQCIRKPSGNAACSGDDRETVVTESNQRRVPVGESPETPSSDIVFQRRMAQKVTVANAFAVSSVVSYLVFWYWLKFANRVQGN
ncbi:hypothetical protein EV2_020265 [Malus domestica]